MIDLRLRMTMALEWPELETVMHVKYRWKDENGQPVYQLSLLDVLGELRTRDFAWDGKTLSDPGTPAFLAKRMDEAPAGYSLWQEAAEKELGL